MKNTDIPHIKSSDVYELAIKKSCNTTDVSLPPFVRPIIYEDEPVYWIVNYDKKIVWIMISKDEQKPYIVDDIENLKQSQYNFIDTFKEIKTPLEPTIFKMPDDDFEDNNNYTLWNNNKCSPK